MTRHQNSRPPKPARILRADRRSCICIVQSAGQALNFRLAVQPLGRSRRFWQDTAFQPRTQVVNPLDRPHHNGAHVHSYARYRDVAETNRNRGEARNCSSRRNRAQQFGIAPRL